MEYKTLETLYRKGKAKLTVDRINHREFIFDKNCYKVGWDSTKTSDSPHIGPYKVRGWIIYDVTKIKEDMI